MRRLVVLLFGLALGSACTPGDACLRHSDCDNGLVCTEGRCSVPPVETPASDANVEVGDATIEAGDADAAAIDASDSSDSSADSKAEVGDADAAEADADVGSDSIVDALGDSFDTGP